MEIPISSWLPAAFNTSVPSIIAGPTPDLIRGKIEPTIPMAVSTALSEVWSLESEVGNQRLRTQDSLSEANVSTDIERLIANDQNKPVINAPADDGFKRFKIPGTSIISFFDVLEQKNNIPPDPQAWTPDNYLSKQDSNQLSLRGAKETKQTDMWGIALPSARNDTLENGLNNQIPILNSIQQGMDITEPEIRNHKGGGEKHPLEVDITYFSSPHIEGREALPLQSGIESKTQPAASGTWNLGMLDTNPPTHQAPAHVEATSNEYGAMSEKSFSRRSLLIAFNGVSLLEKPVEQQSASTVSLKASPKNLLLTPLSPSDKPSALTEADTMFRFAQSLPSLSQQAHTAKGAIIIEPPPPFGNGTLDRLVPLKVRLLTGLTVMSEGELLEIDPLNAIQKVNDLAPSTGSIAGSIFKIEPTERSKGKDAQPSSPPFAIDESRTNSFVRDEQKPNLVSLRSIFDPFALPEDKDTASPVRGSMLYKIIPVNPDNLVTLEASNKTSETNNKPPLLNQIQQEIHINEPKIIVKDVINQYMAATNDMIEVTDVITNEGKDKTKSPQTIIAPLNTNNIKPLDTAPPTQTVDKQTIVHQNTTIEHTVAKEHTKNTQTEKTDIQLNVNKSNTESNNPAYGDDNPRRHVAGQNLLTLSMDYKISTNTQTGTKPEIVQNETSNLPSQPSNVKHYVETQDVASLHNEETKTVDLLSHGKGGVTPPLPPIDEQHKNLPANLITNEQNTSINTLPHEDSVKQPVKDTPKMNNPHQIPKSDYNNIIEQIAQKVRVYLQEGRSDIKLRLEPPELGQIKLKFSVTGNRLEASIEVENLNVMRAIERDIPRLKESISSAGIDVGRLDVLCHEGNDGYHRPYFAQHTDSKIQNSTKEDTNIETVEKADERLTVTGINNALDIGRIDYIV